MEQGANARSSPRPGGRPTSKLVVKEEGRRPLFSTSNASQSESALKNSEKKTAQSTDGPRASNTPRSARRTNSESLGSHSANNMPSPSTGGTRLPRPAGSGGFSNRRPISLSEAYRLAEVEELQLGKQDSDDMRAQPIDGSPSPAPRPWRASRDFDNTRLRQLLEHDHLDTKAANRQLKTSEPTKKNSLPTTTPLKSPVKNPVKSPVKGPVKGPTKTPLKSPMKSHGPTNTETNGGGISLPDLVPGIEDLPLPSVETAENGTAPVSPEQSFVWLVDEDFTAGDLQVSDSPRLKTDRRPFENRLPFDENSEVDINSRTRVNNPGSKNTRLDEIRSREVKTGNHLPIGPRSLRTTTNTKLEEIIAREAEVESQIPIPDRRLSSTSKNTKLDEIRQRELDGLSKRRLAAARLEEIREKNYMSRPKSPDEARTPSDRQSDGPPSNDGSEANLDTSEKKQEKTEVPPKDAIGSGERIPDTPVTVYKSRRERAADLAETKGEKREEQNSDSKKTTKSTPFSRRRADSKDLLSRLARATSSSPLLNSETKKATSHREGDKISTSAASSATSRLSKSLLSGVAGRRKKAGNAGESKTSERPTVEFAGLRRVRSTESSGSKRFSTHSETDPTDRIEAEMKLFAPHDNHSERGSVRAPSPASSDGQNIKKELAKDEEMTPQKNNIDPLTMPTPRVTGAYVETPATVKVERIREPIQPQEIGLPQADRGRVEENRVGRASGIHTGGARRRVRDTSSDPGAGESEGTRSSSTSVPRRRARSLSRSRAPLKNSVKPPSVKDDLKELQRIYSIEDSTLDELEDVIAGKAVSPELRGLLEELPSPSENQDDDSFDLKLEANLADLQRNLSRMSHPDDINEKIKDESDEGELAAYDRMSKSLQTGLLGIRTAKKGIERLEGNLLNSERFYSNAHAKVAAMEAAEKRHLKHQEHNQHQPHHEASAPPTTSHAHSSSVAYVQLPLPRLYTRRPHFQLTILGIFTMLLSLWYVAETSMCAKYCIPVSCSTTPCVWSYDDPTFGNALPIKVDQWTTGGVGRVAFSNTRETVEDWLADMADSLYGRDIKDIDISQLSFDGRRAHRRRLRNKGLLNDEAKQVEKAATPEIRARWAAWRRERINRENAREARSMGYEQNEDESIGGDQRIG